MEHWCYIPNLRRSYVPVHFGDTNANTGRSYLTTNGWWNVSLVSFCNITEAAISMQRKCSWNTSQQCYACRTFALQQCWGHLFSKHEIPGIMGFMNIGVFNNPAGRDYAWSCHSDLFFLGAVFELAWKYSWARVCFYIHRKWGPRSVNEGGALKNGKYIVRYGAALRGYGLPENLTSSSSLLVFENTLV